MGSHASGNNIQREPTIYDSPTPSPPPVKDGWLPTASNLPTSWPVCTTCHFIFDPQHTNRLLVAFTDNDEEVVQFANIAGSNQFQIITKTEGAKQVKADEEWKWMHAFRWNLENATAQNPGRDVVQISRVKGMVAKHQRCAAALEGRRQQVQQRYDTRQQDQGVDLSIGSSTASHVPERPPVSLFGVPIQRMVVNERRQSQPRGDSEYMSASSLPIRKRPSDADDSASASSVRRTRTAAETEIGSIDHGTPASNLGRVQTGIFPGPASNHLVQRQDNIVAGTDLALLDANWTRLRELVGADPALLRQTLAVVLGLVSAAYSV